MLATAIIIALSVLSCSTAEAKKNYTFAVVAKSTSNPFFQSVKSGCEEQANLLTQGSDSNDIFTCLFTGPVDQDATEQVAIVKNLIDAGEVDGIALSVIDEATGDESSIALPRLVYPSSPLIVMHLTQNEKPMLAPTILLLVKSWHICSNLVLPSLQQECMQSSPIQTQTLF